MTMDRSDYSSRDYAREAEATRYRLSHDLNELSDRLTPGQVFDEMLTYARGGSGTFLRALSNAARENPIPSLLIGAGCMLFLSEKMGLNRYVGSQMAGDGTNGHSMGARATHAMSGAASSAGSAMADAASGVSNAAGRAYDTAASTTRSAASSVASGVRGAADYASEQAAAVGEGVRRGYRAAGDTVSSASERVAQTAHDLRDQAASAAEQARHTAQRVGDTVMEYSAAAGEQALHLADQASRQTLRTARKVKQTTASIINEQPLLVAGVGLAVGAIIAAMLPRTETEDEYLGEAADAVKEKVANVASEQYEAAKEAAGRVAQSAMSAAESEGLTAGSAADVARSLGEKVKTVVSETAAAGQSEVREFAGSAADKASDAASKAASSVGSDKKSS